ncbi:sensor histidine kinase [Pacificimonas sp. ICDLI1SI03]
MRIFEHSEAIRSSPFIAWGLGIIFFAAALATRFAFHNVLPAGFPYLTFFPAVILTTFFAGVRPGITCATLSGLSAWFWFIPPLWTFDINSSVLVALGFYACIIGVDIVLIDVMHKAVQGLRREKETTRILFDRQKDLLEDQKVRERQQEVLQKELAHRMKNTLAMVQAIVSQSLRNASDPKVAAELTSARIMALARAQDALTATDWSAADVETIVRTAVAPLNEGGDRFVILGPRVRLETQRSLGLSLAVHELATNAVKYGALSNANGHVKIEWDSADTNEFTFIWTENGGPEVRAPSHLGFGSRLTQRVVPSYFDGSVTTDYAPAGLIYRLDGSLVSRR